MLNFLKLFYCQSTKIIPIQILYGIISGAFVGLSYQSNEHLPLAIGFYLLLIVLQFSNNPRNLKFTQMYNSLPIKRSISYWGVMIVSFIQSIFIILVAITLCKLIEDSITIKIDIIPHLLFFMFLGFFSCSIVLTKPFIAIPFSLIMFIGFTLLQKLQYLEVTKSSMTIKLMFISFIFFSILFFNKIYKSKEVK